MAKKCQKYRKVLKRGDLILSVATLPYWIASSQPDLAGNTQAGCWSRKGGNSYALLYYVSL